MDGIHPNHSAGLLKPYTDDPTYVSDTILGVEEVRDLLLELDQENLDLHVHTRVTWP